MSTIISATFDGTVFRPTEPVSLPPNTTVQLTIDAFPQNTGEPYCFLELARSLKLDAPPDFAQNIDEYLYHGKPLDGS